MAKTKTQEKELPTIIDDSILVGILIAKKHKTLPAIDDKKRVHYEVYGDVEKSLKEIYNNDTIGCLDVYNSVKQARSMIFALKGGQR